MAMNLIQFQRGLPLPEFLRAFGSEEKCMDSVMAARWPAGFCCPRCDCPRHCVLGEGRRRLFQCNACHHQTSMIAETVYASTKLPLTTWFLATYLLSQSKTGMSSLALKRHLGVSYRSAWLLQHKIMATMGERDASHQLAGHVQLDDAYLGGERAGGKPGRGSENKVPFVAAVSLDDNMHPRFVKLTPVKGFTLNAIADWARACLKPGATVLSDGLPCFAAISAAGCTHHTTVVGDRKPRELPEFKWVNTVLGNLKTSLAGTHHAFGYAKYAASYLAAFAYRFNRRFDLHSLTVRLLIDLAQSAPKPLRLIRVAEECA